MSTLAKTQLDIVAVCDEIKTLLLEKNKKYGDSALNPVRVFSQADVLEQLKVRMDDKLSRIRTSSADDSEDAYLDLLGYLVLYRVALRQQQAENPPPYNYTISDSGISLMAGQADASGSIQWAATN